jgi:hypothetical protein
MRPLGLQFSVGGLYTLTPWPIGQALVLHVNLHVVLHQITRPFCHPSTQLQGYFWYTFLSSQSIIGTSYRVITEHQFDYMDIKILMVLDIPQGDPVPLSRHC